MTDRELLERLHALLSAEAARYGATIDTIDAFDVPLMEIYPCGRTGVIAFIKGYALCGWEDHDIHAASRDALRHLQEYLEGAGVTLHMVHPLNLRSVRLTRKLGAKPLGVDADGFIHYRLTLADHRARQS